MTLKAKPIVNGTYWVVTDGNRKVGNVIAEGSGFDVKLGNNIKHYNTKQAVKKETNIQFEKLEKASPATNPAFAVYPTTSNRIYNSVLDVKRKLHIFTKTPKSKCYHVAGWFAIKQGEDYTNVFCPKYIFVQRYDYIGPFKTESELNSRINNV